MYWCSDFVHSVSGCLAVTQWVFFVDVSVYCTQADMISYKPIYSSSLSFHWSANVQFRRQSLQSFLFKCVYGRVNQLGFNVRVLNGQVLMNNSIQQVLISPFFYKSASQFLLRSLIKSSNKGNGVPPLFCTLRASCASLALSTVSDRRLMCHFWYQVYRQCDMQNDTWSFLDDATVLVRDWTTRPSELVWLHGKESQ